MEWLASVLTSSNAIPIIIIVVLLVVIIAILAKKGIVSFKGKGLTVGNNETERTIIRNQIMFVNTEISDFYSKIPFFDGRDEWRLKFIMEKCLDVFVDAISLNHITLEPMYVELKCRAVWDEVLQNSDNPTILSDDFKKTIYDETKKIIEKLIDIREYYNK